MVHEPRFRESFFSDLLTVHAEAGKSEFPSAFLADLAAVAPSARAAAARPERRLSFDLGSLAQRLDDWREASLRAVRSRLKEVLPDDPLRCPISLFGTMDFGRLERAHTNTLAWLLNPSREHGFGSRLLEALLNRVAGDFANVEAVNVLSECAGPTRHDTGRGRIDVLATGYWTRDLGRREAWLLAIEAKIGALEGKDQLSDYEDWTEKQCPYGTRLHVYLTPDRRPPESGRGKWHQLSFQDLASTFRVQLNGLHDRPGYHFLRYYLSGVLQDICKWNVPIGDDCTDPYSLLDYLEER